MILCCRIPDVPIAALLLEQEREGRVLRDRPLVVGGYPSERKPVQAASPEARSFGVCAGMPLRQAEQLCPAALFFPSNPEAEAALARQLLAGLYALAPRVELEDGAAYVDLDGMGLRSGAGSEGLLAFAEEAGAYLERRLLTRPRLGIGANKFVAYTAAALDSTAPVLVPAGRERSFLSPLSIGAHLPVDPDLVVRLKLFGLRTLGDFASMPLAAVEAQFRAEGAWALKLARGEDPRPLLPWEPPLRMRESSHLDPAVDNLEPLLFLARGLVDRLGDRLVEGGYAATVVRLQVETEEGVGEELTLRLRLPMSTPDELWTPVAGLIRKQRMDRPVSGLGLRVSGFCPAGSRQMDLLVRRDGRLEDIVRQLAMLEEGAQVRVRMPALAVGGIEGLATPPALLDERRQRWVDPGVSLARQAAPTRRAAMARRVGRRG